MLCMMIIKSRGAIKKGEVKRRRRPYLRRLRPPTLLPKSYFGYRSTRSAKSTRLRDPQMWTFLKNWLHTHKIHFVLTSRIPILWSQRAAVNEGDFKIEGLFLDLILCIWYSFHNYNFFFFEISKIDITNQSKDIPN